MEDQTLYTLVQAIRLVALDSFDQLKVFPPPVFVPDEIAQILDDAMVVFESSAKTDFMEEDVFRKIKALNEYFAELPKGEFSLGALVNSPSWEKSRRLARQILSDLNIEATHPDLSWMRFI